MFDTIRDVLYFVFVFRKYYFKIRRSGRRCVPADFGFDKSTYIKSRIKKYRKRFPNKKIYILVSYIHQVKKYMDMIKGKQVDFVIPKIELSSIWETKDILIFSDSVPHADILLKPLNMHQYFVFGLY